MNIICKECGRLHAFLTDVVVSDGKCPDCGGVFVQNLTETNKN